MKAESIEQIREHLAKGGRVVGRRACSNMTWNVYVPPIAFGDEWEYELLPLEEKEPVHDGDCSIYSSKSNGLPTDGICNCGYELRQSRKPVDHGTQKGQAKDGRDPMPCELNREAYLDLLREDFDWLVEQPRSLEREHIKEVLSWLMKNRPDGTQKVQEEIYVVGPHDGTPEQQAVRQRIRTRLLHGMWPEMSDLMAWWEATTGERIEWGKRCERCKASGRVKRLLPIGYDWITCLDCNGSGYAVRPTWMNQ